MIRQNLPRQARHTRDGNMETIIRRVLYVGPLIFAFGFLMPLIMQAMERFGWTAPFELSTLTFSAILAGTLGIIAQIRGRWI